MANLVSPGVQVSVIDESFYTSAGQGTIPLIFIATKENKATPDGSAVASGTLKANADQLYLIGSQRELIQTFGSPDFNSVGNTAQNGNVLNEYGLLAAHSFLGVSNRAYVLRADIDLAQLAPTVTEPTSNPVDMTYWTDLNSLIPGLFISTGVTVNDWEAVDVTMYEGAVIDGAVEPASGFVNGDYILAADSSTGFSYFLRAAGVWTEVVAAAVAPHTEVPVPGAPGEYWLKTTTPNNGAAVSVQVFDSEVNQFVSAGTVLFVDDSADFYTLFPANSIAAGTLAAFTSANPLGFTLNWHNGQSTTVYQSTVAPVVAPAATMTINGFNFAVAVGGVDEIVAAISAESIPNVVASKVGDQLRITNTAGEDLVISTVNISGYNSPSGTYSNFSLVSDAAPAYFASVTQPSTGPSNGALWYNPGFDVDILVNDGAGAWIEFASDVYVQPDQPTGAVVNDLWVETDQLIGYPVIRRLTGAGWVLVDNTDQTTPLGIVFADARPAPGAALDSDAPNPLVYPGGMLLWNTRYSTRNVKQWNANHADGARWVTASGNNQDGSPVMGQAAVRRVVADSIAASIISNEGIRSETLFFNLIAAPGFPELSNQMLTLNIDRKETAFVIGDSPFDLEPGTTSLNNWVTNLNIASENIAIYYPHGLTRNLDGTEVVVPASHMVLRTFALNDQVSYPWFAPAGYQRGRVTNADRVGYINSEGEFTRVRMGQAQRDVLYINNVNSIVDVQGRGIFILGQKTRGPVESALDRINVARLTNYIRFQAERISEPFLFEPNDTQTRNAVAERYETFMSELVTLRGVFDFLVVCSTDNNTPARIDRNELWIDLAFAAIPGVEFIYIPIRVRNTGADLTI